MALDVGPIPEGFCGIVDFDIKTPCSGEEILANVAHARSLGLPEANLDQRVLRVIANGPSALSAPLDGPTLALNGALKLFAGQRWGPTYWAACDPQALVADFIPEDPPQNTTYLVATKCHPSVFERLKGRDVRTWDVSDFVTEGRPVPCASSITSTVPGLMLQLGWSRFEVWGWDCCFMGERHHAADQPHTFPEVLTIEIDGREYQTTRTWAAEAQDFANKLKPIFDYLGTEITIMGDGYLKTFLGGSQAVLKP